MESSVLNFLRISTSDELDSPPLLRFRHRSRYRPPDLPFGNRIEVKVAMHLPAGSWIQWFFQRPSNDIHDKDGVIYQEAWSSEREKDDRFDMLLSEQDVVLFARDAHRNVITLHNFKAFGGTLIRPSRKVCALMGGGCNAPVVQVHVSSLLVDCRFQTPPVDALMDCTSAFDVKNFDMSDEENCGEFCGSASFLGPPWLVQVIMGADTGEPSELIPIVIAAATQFDDEHKDDKEFTTSAVSIAESFVMWLWGVHTGKVPATRSSIDVTNVEFENYKRERELLCILPATGTTQPTFTVPPGLPPAPDSLFGANVGHQLIECLTRQNENLDTHLQLEKEMLEMKRSKEEKESNRSKDLHEPFLKMIRFASAEDGDSPVPEKPVDSCLKILNKKSQQLAGLELRNQFNLIKMKACGFLPGLIAQLYLGRFLWTNPLSPSNFSPFSFFELSPMDMKEHNEQQVLCHTIQEYGQGQSVEELTKASNQTVKVPTDYKDMLQQLKYFAGASSIFLGVDSLGTQSLMALVEMVESQCHEFKINAVTDSTYMAKFLLAVDKRFQAWLSDCMEKENRVDVDDDEIDFRHLMRLVRHNEFVIQLPPTFTTASADDKKSDSKSKSGEQKREQKKPRIEYNKEDVVTSEKVDDDFKLSKGELWGIVFKKKAKEINVAWNDSCKMCPRWHIFGSCWKTCEHACSHVPADQVPPEKKELFTSWMAECRKKNKRSN